MQDSCLGDKQVNGLLPAEALAPASEMRATYVVCAAPTLAVEQVGRQFRSDYCLEGTVEGVTRIDSMRLQSVSRR